ncbi:MAG: 3-deoxy-8-phosphooctulonate synthase [Deltaproteobacteria bacterium]
MKEVAVGAVKVGNDLPLVLIAGPCQIESRDHVRMVAERLVAISAATGVPLIFKSSYDKANRTSIKGGRGVGLDEGLTILSDIRREFGVPVLTDVHTEAHCAAVAQAVDVLQIPAFLCRQTDLLLAAGETGAAINIKKGQFLAPWDMQNVAAKVASTGNERLMLTERGVSFGYNTLVTDMRSLPTMAKTGYPVVMDATHAVAQPGGLGASSGGQREFAPVLARAAVSLGIAAVFIETHNDPDRAPSDGPNMIYLDQMEGLMHSLKSFDDLAKANPLRI